MRLQHGAALAAQARKAAEAAAAAEAVHADSRSARTTRRRTLQLQRELQEAHASQLEAERAGRAAAERGAWRRAATSRTLRRT